MSVEIPTLEQMNHLMSRIPPEAPLNPIESFVHTHEPVDGVKKLQFREGLRSMLDYVAKEFES